MRFLSQGAGRFWSGAPFLRLLDLAIVDMAESSISGVLRRASPQRAPDQVSRPVVSQLRQVDQTCQNHVGVKMPARQLPGGAGVVVVVGFDVSQRVGSPV
jgi:hypothetical protein